eukprot:scaffold132572_cov19-Prasinocladus_malaysianus.AAC.1
MQRCERLVLHSDRAKQLRVVKAQHPMYCSYMVAAQQKYALPLILPRTCAGYAYLRLPPTQYDVLANNNKMMCSMPMEISQSRSASHNNVKWNV